MQNCSLPQVSVVIPAYNASKNIAETLETAFNQRFRSFEIKWRGRACLDKEERQAVKRTYLQTQSYLYVRHAVDHIHKGEYSLARMALRRACKWRPKWPYRAAQIGLAVAPGTTRLALRGRS